MPKVLKGFELANDDRVAEVNIGSGRIEAKFDPQRLSGFLCPLDLFTQVFLTDHIDRAFFSGIRVVRQWSLISFCIAVAHDF